MNTFLRAGTADIGNELAYDLRQTYAKIVGDHLEDIAQARKADNYSIYYKTLRDLFVIVKHKIKDKKIKIRDKEGKEEEVTETELFNRLLSEAAKIANQHPQEWLGRSKNPEACAKIEEVLNALEMYLYKQIDEAKMFGSHSNIPGL